MDALNTLYFIGIGVGAVLAAACGALSFSRARKQRDAFLLYHLLTGFYACVLMSALYYLLTWIVMDYPYELSPGVLSWLGAIAFLITAALALTERWSPAQKAAAGRYRLPALIAPAVCAAFYAAFILLYPEETVIYLLYAVPTGILAYCSLWLYLAKKGGGQSAMLRYHLAVLAWVLADLLHNLFTTLGWSYGYAVHSTVSLWILMLAAPALYCAVRVGENSKKKTCLPLDASE